MAKHKRPKPDIKRMMRAVEGAEQLAKIQKHAARMRRIAPRHFLPFSKAYREAMAVKRRYFKLSKEAKIRFLKNNQGVAASVVADIGKGKSDRRAGAKWSGRNLAEVLRKIESKPVALNELVFKTVTAIERAEMKKLKPTLAEHLKKYLKTKGKQFKTDIEKEAFERTVDWLLQETSVGKKPGRALNLSAIRIAYFLHERRLRLDERGKTTYLNSVYGEVFGREKFTRNQRRAARQWLQENYKLLEKEKGRLAKKVLPGGEKAATESQLERLSQEYDKAEQHFKERVRKETMAMFREREKKLALELAPSRAVGTKAGTRAERMAAYQASEKKRAKEVAGKEVERPKVAGKKFDPISFMLAEIGKESRKSGAFLKGLHGKGLITQDSLSRLFKSGSLTQKLFQRVAEDREFRALFGGKQINWLARGLAYIGPGGRQTEGVKKQFQGEKGKKLFEFLVKRKFLDTKHGKRLTVTYLARIKGK